MESGSWDAVVLGAGIGGLTAAARLSRSGARVLVLDQNPQVGGTAGVYRRKGFSFPKGPLGFSSPAVIARVLAELGIHPPPQMNRVHYRVLHADHGVPISLPFSRLISIYQALWPDQRGGIRGFFRDIKDLHNRLTDGSGSPRQLKKAARTPAAAYLDARITDSTLRRLLGSLGTSEPYSSLLRLAVNWNLMCEQGIHYPSGGVEKFCRTLADAVIAPPGKTGERSEIRTGVRVQEILIKQGRVAGVSLSTGEQISCPAVVSNADFKNTFLHLIHPRSIPPEWTVRIRRSRETASNLQVCLGFDSAGTDLGIFEKASRLITRLFPEDEKNRDDHGYPLLSQELELSLWSADDPSLAPAGGGVLVVRTEADYNQFSFFSPAPGQRTPEYKVAKEKLARFLIRELEKRLPGLEANIRAVDVATPLTFQDRGGRSRGAVAGWSWDFEDSLEHRSRELIRTPVSGLYMAGYQAFSTLFLGGVPTAMESGLRAADAVANRLGPDMPDLP